MLTWQAEGDTVILVADMNKDVRVPAIQDMLRAVGLVDGPTMQHSSPPATYNRGMNPIDGIFIPINLVDQCSSGYLEFGAAVPSDHRALWLDIPARYVCSLERESIERPPAHRLHCKDPRVVAQYNKILWDSLDNSGLAQKVRTLAQQTTNRFSREQQEAYETIDRAATEFKCHAKKTVER